MPTYVKLNGDVFRSGSGTGVQVYVYMCGLEMGLSKFRTTIGAMSLDVIFQKWWGRF